MFGPPGFSYVYLVYGMHHCLNVVAGPDGAPAAVLIRAVEPLDGLAAMRDARAAVRRPSPGAARAAATVISGHRLAAGPALVCACFGIDRSFTGLDLCDPASPLHLVPGASPLAVSEGPRVGIGYAGEPSVSQPWRLADASSPALSRPLR